MLSAADVAKHNSSDSCWIIVDGQVYDVTEFLHEHPGGSAIILKYAGRDATEAYEPIHPPSALDDNLPPEKRLGKVDPLTIVKDVAKVPQPASQVQPLVKFSLSQMISLHDFEEAAQENLSKKAWAYFSSGATDQITLAMNQSVYQKVFFQPRTMVDVSSVSTKSTMLGHPVDIPIFICPTGMAKLSHPTGEVSFAKAAEAYGIMFMMSTNASSSVSDVVKARTSKPAPPCFFQLYVNRDRSKSEALVKNVTASGKFGAIVVTVDAHVAGKREADEKVKAEVVLESGITGTGTAPDAKGGGIGRAMGGYIDPSFSWADLPWVRSLSHLPLGLKGVQTVEDVIKAVKLGVELIYLSNHGGRALDTAPPALLVLLSLRKHHPWVFDRAEIYIDGGIRRGTDVVKALCLGAKAVGLGRPFLYALSYGLEGVEKAIEVLRDEVETTMQLLGVTSIDQLGPHLLNTKALEPLIPDPPILSASIRARL
ncbi:hypothetical protein BOTBODRAFT_99401 [Botryobasidium botryosum FD-172 SS1]|uniref:L-lactate dehydrogenase (cytochrome) n=1 Tax=Botryobasidium botryosum (strain FD-172 SS1) TaxID=930990 RepID=A0A067NCU6_BOTB1|nr:hypothetical protein BOTBODRAFT_99401 [Botryobasidium botryosum FD-172 SS1]